MADSQQNESNHLCILNYGKRNIHVEFDSSNSLEQKEILGKSLRRQKANPLRSLLQYANIFRLTPKIFLGTNFEYFHRKIYPRNTNIYSEGMVFMLAVRYNP